ncbi:MAG: GGDEF domain-containing protein [Planctomycetaceae bacterium]|nr:GGDEF domain-containing protein [Phycisphaerales bacterium]MCE2652270.1 GGDEF domain-containing protein [Planctomycetaceae bacterium]
MSSVSATNPRFHQVRMAVSQMTSPTGSTGLPSIHARQRSAQSGSILLLCVLASLLVGLLDLIAGRDVSVLALYVVPVAVAAWFGSLAIGTATAIVAAVIWFFAQVLLPDNPVPGSTEAWNALMRAVVFIFIALTTGLLQSVITYQRRSATTDPVTGLENRAGLLERTAALVNACRHAGRPITIVSVDIRALRDINAAYGQQRGDVVVTLTARALWQVARAEDIVARLDGDQFAIVLPGAGESEARRLADELHTRLSDIAHQAGCSVSHTIAVLHAEQPPLLGDELIHAVEAAVRALRDNPAGPVISRFPTAA